MPDVCTLRGQCLLLSPENSKKEDYYYISSGDGCYKVFGKYTRKDSEKEHVL